MGTLRYKGFTYTITSDGVTTPVLQQWYQKKGWADPYAEMPDERQVELCMDWLKQYATPRKRVNSRIDSYSLKHVVERWAGTYIANGAFIEAVYRMGWDIVPNGPRNPNARFRLNYDQAGLR